MKPLIKTFVDEDKNWKATITVQYEVDNTMTVLDWKREPIQKDQSVKPIPHWFEDIWNVGWQSINDFDREDKWITNLWRYYQDIYESKSTAEGSNSDVPTRFSNYLAEIQSTEWSWVERKDYEILKKHLPSVA